MIVGFTGTREGMNSSQHAGVLDRLGKLFAPGAGFAHGDCVGADEQAHFAAQELGYLVQIFPPDQFGHRAFCEAPTIHKPRPFKIRNGLIVLHADVLVAAPPAAETDAVRSGSWQTVRMARRKNIPIFVIDHTGLELHEPPRVLA